ncbi:hypothetical protein [Inquilinus limosus]|uniref:hypothetical protein n=1 Tax=Inquilinus limosus TaxID=171674 RepID=UPI001269B1B3|nr:hypothetical protein [Inquilinus limosus]
MSAAELVALDMDDDDFIDIDRLLECWPPDCMCRHGGLDPNCNGWCIADHCLVENDCDESHDG